MEQLACLEQHSKCHSCLKHFHYDDDHHREESKGVSLMMMTVSSNDRTSKIKRRISPPALRVSALKASTSPRFPVASRKCHHTICKPCLVSSDVSNASSCGGRRRTSSARFLACPMCHASQAFSKRPTVDKALQDGLKVTKGKLRPGILSTLDETQRVPLSVWPSAIEKVNAQFNDGTTDELPNHSRNLQVNVVHDLLRIGLLRNTGLYAMPVAC